MEGLLHLKRIMAVATAGRQLQQRPVQLCAGPHQGLPERAQCISGLRRRTIQHRGHLESSTVFPLLCLAVDSSSGAEPRSSGGVATGQEAIRSFKTFFKSFGTSGFTSSKPLSNVRMLASKSTGKSGALACLLAFQHVYGDD